MSEMMWGNSGARDTLKEQSSKKVMNVTQSDVKIVRPHPSTTSGGQLPHGLRSSSKQQAAAQIHVSKIEQKHHQIFQLRQQQQQEGRNGRHQEAV